MPANGSTREPNTISDSHSESTPSSSTRSTASPNTAGTAAGPSEIPILTFMPPSDHEPARARARHQDRRPPSDQPRWPSRANSHRSYPWRSAITPSAEPLGRGQYVAPASAATATGPMSPAEG